MTEKLTEPKLQEAAKKLGETLSIARELRGYTLRELAERSGLSNSHISQLEHGKDHEPRITTLIRLAHALGLTPERLMKPYIEAAEGQTDG